MTGLWFICDYVAEKCLNQPDLLNPPNTELWTENLSLWFLKVFAKYCRFWESLAHSKW